MLRQTLLAMSLETVFVLGLVLLPGAVEAQTILSGNISGTWTTAGNPYIISDNATVPAGQTLTIQPGVTIWIGAGLSITVNGGISALGTPEQHVTFKAPVDYQFWNGVVVNNGQSNCFSYCDFANATNALSFSGPGSNDVEYSTFQNVNNGISLGVQDAVLQATIANCAFSNCWGQAVYGAGRCQWGGGKIVTVLPVIKNCSFNAVNNGCSFYVSGSGYYGSAYSEVQILGTIFHKVTNTAVALTQGGGATVCPATLVNNAFVNASNAVVFQDPWDARMQNSILARCTNAVTVAGSLSRSVSYNDFFNNATNFIGYPGTYGSVILANRNGTPCDLLFNIFANPLFADPASFALQPTSPCVDAGEGSATNHDSYFPPSLGTTINDMGAYGGPSAGGWVPAVASAPFTLAASPLNYVTVTIHPPAPGHYRLDYASVLGETNRWMEITNMDLSAPFLYIEPASFPARMYRAVKLY